MRVGGERPLGLRPLLLVVMGKRKIAMNNDQIEQVEQKIVELSGLSPNAVLLFEQLQQTLPNMAIEDLNDVLLYMDGQQLIKANIQSYQNARLAKTFTITTAFISKHL
jgi:hypothetical protein